MDTTTQASQVIGNNNNHFEFNAFLNGEKIHPSQAQLQAIERILRGISDSLEKNTPISHVFSPSVKGNQSKHAAELAQELLGIKVSLEKTFERINQTCFSDEEQKKLYLNLVSKDHRTLTKKEIDLFLDHVDKNIPGLKDEAEILIALLKNYSERSDTKLDLTTLYRVTVILNSRREDSSNVDLKKQLIKNFAEIGIPIIVVGETKRTSGTIPMNPSHIFQSLLFEDMDEESIDCLVDIVSSDKIKDEYKTSALKALLDSQKLTSDQLLKLVQGVESIEEVKDKKSYLEEIYQRKGLSHSVYMAILKKSSQVGIFGFLKAHKIELKLLGGLGVLSAFSALIINNLETIAMISDFLGFKNATVAK